METAQKRLLSFLLSLALALGIACGISATAHADTLKAATSGTTYVAKVGDTNYETLGAALGQWNDGTTLTLLQDVESTDYIFVYNDTKTLDLNGHSFTKKGPVSSAICVSQNGNLAIKGPGTITGGVGMAGFDKLTYRRGGGIYVGLSAQVTVDGATISGNTANWGAGVYVCDSGTLTMNNCTISNNESTKVYTGYSYEAWNNGGAAFVENNGTLILNSCLVTGNTSENGKFCGIYLNQDEPNNATLQVSGKTAITNNAYNGQQMNVSGTLSVIGKLTEGAKIGITHDLGVFTDTSSSNIQYNDETKFTSDNTNYSVSKNTDGQLILETRTTVEMHRLYNPNSGEHFYTSNEQEKSNLVSLGWTDEGVGWTAPIQSNTPVYRLYNPHAGEHHFTTSKDERDNLISLGWNDEGIGWYSDDNKAVPVYRQYNPNAFACNHNFTASKSENDWLVSLGWIAEGIGWYGV